MTQRKVIYKIGKAANESVNALYLHEVIVCLTCISYSREVQLFVLQSFQS